MARLIALIFGVLSAFAGIELGLRVLWPQPDVHLHEVADDGVYFHTPDFSNLSARNPYSAFLELRKRIIPSTPKVKFYPAFVQTNSAGERDDREHSFKRGQETFRIIGVGQCASFGLDIPDQKTFLRLLERELPETEAINCSLHGASLAEARAIFEERCSRYDADLILVPMMAQDFGMGPFRGRLIGADRRLVALIYRNIGDKVAELLEMDSEGIVRLKETARKEWLPAYQRYYRPGLPLYHQLNIVRFLENRWASFSLIPHPEKEILPILAKFYQLKNEDQYPRAGLETQLKHLRKLKDLGEARKMKMLVVLLPLKDIQYTKSYSAEASWFREQLTREFAVLDLGTKIDPPSWTHLLVDGNMPSEEGHHWLAKEIASALRARYPRKSVSSPVKRGVR